jgi:hypothetical protein
MKVILICSKKIFFVIIIHNLRIYQIDEKLTLYYYKSKI